MGERCTQRWWRGAPRACTAVWDSTEKSAKRERCTRGYEHEQLRLRTRSSAEPHAVTNSITHIKRIAITLQHTNPGGTERQ